MIALEAPSEDLDVIERSPNLPLHFADENSRAERIPWLECLRRSFHRGHEALDLAKYWQQKLGPS